MYHKALTGGEHWVCQDNDIQILTLQTTSTCSDVDDCHKATVGYNTRNN